MRVFLLAIHIYDGNILTVCVVYGVFCAAWFPVPDGDYSCRVIYHPLVSGLIDTSFVSVTNISCEVGSLHDRCVPLLPFGPTVDEVRMRIGCDQFDR